MISGTATAFPDLSREAGSGTVRDKNFAHNIAGDVVCNAGVTSKDRGMSKQLRLKQRVGSRRLNERA
jgi:hypothetical protein